MKLAALCAMIVCALSMPCRGMAQDSHLEVTTVKVQSYAGSPGSGFSNSPIIMSVSWGVRGFKLLGATTVRVVGNVTYLNWVSGSPTGLGGVQRATPSIAEYEEGTPFVFSEPTFVFDASFGAGGPPNPEFGRSGVGLITAEILDGATLMLGPASDSGALKHMYVDGVYVDLTGEFPGAGLAAGDSFDVAEFQVHLDGADVDLQIPDTTHGRPHRTLQRDGGVSVSGTVTIGAGVTDARISFNHRLDFFQKGEDFLTRGPHLLIFTRTPLRVRGGGPVSQTVLFLAREIGEGILGENATKNGSVSAVYRIKGTAKYSVGGEPPVIVDVDAVSNFPQQKQF